jgi:hypothetical protein
MRGSCLPPVCSPPSLYIPARTAHACLGQGVRASSKAASTPDRSLSPPRVGEGNERSRGRGTTRRRGGGLLTRTGGAEGVRGKRGWIAGKVWGAQKSWDPWICLCPFLIGRPPARAPPLSPTVTATTSTRHQQRPRPPALLARTTADSS